MQDTEETAKKWHMIRAVSGLGEEIDEQQYESLASAYEAEFKSQQEK